MSMEALASGDVGRYPPLRDASAGALARSGRRLWGSAAEVMVEQLAAAGLITDAAIAEAFRSVNRPHLVSTIFRRDPADEEGWAREHRDEADPQTWVARLSAPEVAITTAITEADVVLGRPTAAAVSPPPATLAWLLQQLDLFAPDLVVGPRRVRQGAVLDVGTGCGYTAALLSHIVGSGRVTTVDIDPDQAQTAGAALAELDLTPRCTSGDSMVDLPSGVYDRVLIGHTIDHIPGAWIAHTRSNTIMLAELTGSLGARRHILLRRAWIGPGVVLSGRFLPGPPRPASPQRRGAAQARRRTRTPRSIAPSWVTDVAVDPRALHDGSAVLLLCQAMLPHATTMRLTSTATTEITRLRAADGSWAEISHRRTSEGRYPSRGAGPTDLLKPVVVAANTFTQLDRPDWTDFGITVTADGRNVLWHRHVGGPEWDLPTAVVLPRAPRSRDAENAT